MKIIFIQRERRGIERFFGGTGGDFMVGLIFSL